MKTVHSSFKKIYLAILLFTGFSLHSLSQGRVVINEYLPWPSNGCGVTSEFVELLNFGPGPVNIGCYILTDGDFAITIPPNTILQPGQFYVISGQNIISTGCANNDSAIHVNLNWTTCGCTSGTIPTTGDGFMTDGGSANEQIVLLDPNLNIVDAVARITPVEPSANITTSTAGGSCTAKTFDLDNLSINYETIGESAGRGNSIARKLDGDCVWVKDTQQSGNHSNNTSGTTSNVSYSLTYTQARACSTSLGSIVVSVSAPNYSSIFPMQYTLAYDADSNGVFNFSDQYTLGVDSTASTIPVNNLVKGSYRITVASSNNCYLNTMTFTILDCFDLLSLNILSFEALPTSQPNKIECRWSIDHAEYLDRAEIEISSDGINFERAAGIQILDGSRGKKDFRTVINGKRSEKIYLRLRVVDKDKRQHISSVFTLDNKQKTNFQLRSNPARNELKLDISSTVSTRAGYQIFDNENRLLVKGQWLIKEGLSATSIPLINLSRGFYRLVIFPANPDIPSTQYGFVKF